MRDEDGSENPQAFRLSDQLSDEFLEQVTNETRRVRFVKNRPEIDFQFEQLRGEHSAPYDACYMAQCCRARIDALQQRNMVLLGSWKAMYPGQKRQPSYFINALSSPLTSWDKIWRSG